MTDLSAEDRPTSAPQGPLVSRPWFQKWAARFPLTRPFVRREGAEIFKLIQGFVDSQMLMALIELDVFERLSSAPSTCDQLSIQLGMAPQRLQVALRAGVAMKLLRQDGQGAYSVTMRAQAMLSVPGLQDMVRHHHALYDDLRDPVALLRNPTDTHLAAFWPYVFAGGQGISEEDAQRYSDLMAKSQILVAQDTLDLCDLSGARHLMDVGGGSGAFLRAAAERYPDLGLTLFDLPETQVSASRLLGDAGLLGRVDMQAGSFRSDPLPVGADTVSLVRVCYDHDDDTVMALLRAVHGILPPGGRLIVSEPMSGGAKPDRITDVYFAIYTLAMGTGCTRSAEDLSQMMRKAGFSTVTKPRSRRSYITTVIEAVRQS